LSLRTLSDHIADICQNAIKAGAKNIRLEIIEDSETFNFTVSDDAGGMSGEILKQIYDPFFTSRDKKIRKVGLGIPFLKSAAEMTGGGVSIDSKEGEGTVVRAEFKKHHIDCQPIGNLTDTFFSLITTDKNISMVIRRVFGEDEYIIDTDKIIASLPNPGMWENPKYLGIINESLKEMEASIKD